MDSRFDSEAATQQLDPLVLRARARVGQVLRGKWRLDVLLGVGGMAAVYACTHRNGTRAAVKLLHSELSINPQVRSRFLREGYVANAVAHDGAVKILDDDTAEDGSLFLVTELLDGETLEDRRMRFRGMLTEDEVLSIADQLLDALAAAHAKGIVHRDLKPENVFLTRDGRVKILDFGIARLRELSTASTATRDGSSMGTPAYMPPEQARGLWDEVDARSDLWAVGATMFHLLSGRMVHEGRTTNELLISAATSAAPGLASVASGSSPAVAHVVDRALAFERERRWPDAGQMQAAVRLAYRDRHGAPITTADRLTIPETVPNRTLSSAPGAFASKAPTTGQPVEGSRRATARATAWRRLPQRTPLALGLGCAVVFASLGTGAWMMLRHTANDLPSADRRIVFLAENRGAAHDAWMGHALEHMATRRLGEKDLRVRAVLDSATANVVVRLGYRREGDGVVLDATLGPKNGDKTLITPPAGVHADSVAAALDVILAAALDSAAAGQPERGPDAGELARMKSLGAPSFDAYRRYQALMGALFGSGGVGPDQYQAMARELVRLWPDWARPSATLLSIVRWTNGKDGEAVLAKARANVRDAAGKTVLDAVEHYWLGHYEQAVAALRTPNQYDPHAGFLMLDALGRLRRSQDEIATAQHLYESFPDLQFGANLQADLRAAGRTKDAQTVAAAWLQAQPENDLTLTSEITVDVERDDLDAAVRHAEGMVLLFGASGRLDKLADVATVAGRLDEAGRIANRMESASGADRPQGSLRLGRIAILEGRFSAARDAFQAAVAEGEPFGTQGPLKEAREELVWLLLYTGSASEVDAGLAAFEQSLTGSRSLPVVRLERGLRSRLGACPDLSALRQRAANTPDWEARMSLRVAASAGCAPCAEVLRAGLDGEEAHQRYLFDYGVCAETEGKRDLARDTFVRVERVVTRTTDLENCSSTTHAVLSRLHLARVLARLGEKSGAMSAYRDFLGHWGHADRPLPDVDAARKELAVLGTMQQ